MLIGGVVPGMLVPDPPPGLEAHVGTTDIDLCLSIALVEGNTGEYERIETAIKRLNLAVDGDSFRWSRRGDFKVTLEFFCPTSEARPVGMFRPRAAENPVAKQNFGSTLSAFALEAGDLIVSDVVMVPREVTLPDSGDRLDYDFTRENSRCEFRIERTSALRGSAGAIARTMSTTPVTYSKSPKRASGRFPRPLKALDRVEPVHRRSRSS